MAVILFQAASSSSNLTSSLWLIGQISGMTVHYRSEDQQSALSGVRVILTNDDTGESRVIHSFEDGRFVFVSLRPGDYRVKVRKKHFWLRPQERPEIIRIRVNEPIHVLPDFHMTRSGMDR